MLFQVVRLTFGPFELENDPDCQKDSFTCYDGPDDTADQLFKYCGSQPFIPDVLSTGPYMYCQFLSYSKKGKNTGFKIGYSADIAGMCVYREASGVMLWGGGGVGVVQEGHVWGGGGSRIELRAYPGGMPG